MNQTGGTEVVTMDMSPSSSDAALTDVTFVFTPKNPSDPIASGKYVNLF